MMGYGFGTMGIWSMIIPIALIGFILYVVIKLLQNNNINNSNQPVENALEILKRKYANGEISEEEYNKKRKILKGDCK